MPDEAPPPAGTSTTAATSGPEATFLHRPPRDLEARQIFDKVSARLFGGPGNTSRYEILHKLGAGGMGVVYAAEDPVLACRVALKQLHGHLMAEPGFLDRLRAEARAMARLRSEPHVVDLYDFFVQGDVVFVVMELVDGTTLRAWQATPRPWPEILGKYLQAGLGLAAAHRAGLIHRDFKPENVLLGRGGVAKVSDFGLAHLDRSPTRTHDDLAGDASLTPSGHVLGTARYMSPEQLAGAPLDPRSDQFSFCVALWEALFHNEHPFFPLAGVAPEPNIAPEHASTVASRGTASPAAFAQAIVDGPLRPPPATTAVPGHVVRALTRGLHKSPDGRFPGMDALLAALRDAPEQRGKLRLLGLTACLAGAVAWAWPAPPPAPPPTRAELVEAKRSELVADLELAPLRAHLTAEKFPGAPHLLAELDRYTRRWAEQTATHEFTLQRRPGDPSAHTRLRCLAAARTAARTLTGGLLLARAASAAHAAELVAELPTPERASTAHAAELVDELPAPEECSDMPQAWLACSLELDHLRQQSATRPVFDALQLASRQEAAGEFPQAIAHAAAAVRAAGTHAHPALLGQAHYQHGRLLFVAGRSAEAAAALQTARDAVEATGCIDLRADIYSRLIKVTAIYPSLPAAGFDEWTRIHATLAHDTPDAGARIADAHNERGLFTLLRRHDPRAALADLARAAALREWLLGGRPGLDLADTHLNMAIAHRELGDFTAAAAALAEATRLRRAILGPEHPILYREALERGLLQIDQGDLAAALPSLESALALAEAGFGRDSGPAARAALGLARVHARSRRYDAAITAADTAVERAVAAAIDPSERFELVAFARALAAEYGDPRARGELRALTRELVPGTPITLEAQATLTELLTTAAFNRDDDSEAREQAGLTLDLLARAGVPEAAPRYVAAIRARGLASYYANDLDGAIRDLERMFALHPERSSAQAIDDTIILAMARVERGHPGDRVRICETARALTATEGVDPADLPRELRRSCRMP